MCGILAVLGCVEEAKSGKRAHVLAAKAPEHQVGDCYLSHQRLAIIDPEPLFFLGTEGEPHFH